MSYKYIYAYKVSSVVLKHPCGKYRIAQNFDGGKV